jgi:hypothetical protein
MLKVLTVVMVALPIAIYDPLSAHSPRIVAGPPQKYQDMSGAGLTVLT